VTKARYSHETLLEGLLTPWINQSATRLLNKNEAMGPDCLFKGPDIGPFEREIFCFVTGRF
jgi:hypothetical protein